MVLESTPASTAAPAEQSNVSTAPSTSSQQAPAELDALLSKLMELLLSFPNRSVAIGLALKAASLLEEEQEVSPVSMLTWYCQIPALLTPLSACSCKRLLCAAPRICLQLQGGFFARRVSDVSRAWKQLATSLLLLQQQT